MSSVFKKTFWIYSLDLFEGWALSHLEKATIFKFQRKRFSLFFCLCDDSYPDVLLLLSVYIYVYYDKGEEVQNRIYNTNRENKVK